MSIFFVISFSCWGMPDVCRRIGQAVRRVRSAWIENSGKLEKKCEVVKRLWKKCIRGSRLLFNRLFFSIRYRPVGADPCVRPDILAWCHRADTQVCPYTTDCRHFRMKEPWSIFPLHLFRKLRQNTMATPAHPYSFHCPQKKRTGQCLPVRLFISSIRRISSASSFISSLARQMMSAIKTMATKTSPATMIISSIAESSKNQSLLKISLV